MVQLTQCELCCAASHKLHHRDVHDKWEDTSVLLLTLMLAGYMVDGNTIRTIGIHGNKSHNAVFPYSCCYYTDDLQFDRIHYPDPNEIWDTIAASFRQKVWRYGMRAKKARPHNTNALVRHHRLNKRESNQSTYTMNWHNLPSRFKNHTRFGTL